MSAKEQSESRDFDLAELNEECKGYFMKLEDHPFPKISSTSIPDYITKLKRPLPGTQIGMYSGISFFEALNRIASDLILWYGLDFLINEVLKNQRIEKVGLCLGNENIDEKGDFWIRIGGEDRNGEAFNASESFFKPKIRYTMKKWGKKEKQLHYIFCNTDGYPEGYKPRNVTVWSPKQELIAPDATLLIKIDLFDIIRQDKPIPVPYFSDTPHSV